MSILDLDQAATKIVARLYEAFRAQAWDSVRYVARWTPSGDVGADDFWLSVDGHERKTLPELTPSLQISDAGKHHWQLTQDLGLPRWYKMTVTVERSGKFGVEFEYKDDYKEGDIMQRG